MTWRPTPTDLLAEAVSWDYARHGKGPKLVIYHYVWGQLEDGREPTEREVHRKTGWSRKGARPTVQRAIADFVTWERREGIASEPEKKQYPKNPHRVPTESSPSPHSDTEAHGVIDPPVPTKSPPAPQAGSHAPDLLSTPTGTHGEVPPPEPPPPPRLEGLTRPQREALRAAGYTSTAKLAQARRSEAKALPGIGRKALVVLDRLVEAHGGWQPEPEKDTLASTLCQQASDAFLAAWRRRHPEVEYPWRFKGRNNDRGHQKTLVAIARLHLDHPDRTDRLEAAADLYLEEQAAGRAWPHDGEPATFGTFTKVADRYLLKVQGVRPRDGPPTGSPVGGLTAGARAQNANLSLLARLHNEALDEEAALKEAQNA